MSERDCWTVSTKRDGIVGCHSSWERARRACLNDDGRLLLIQDPVGRIAALYRDGQEVAGDE